MFQCRVGIQCCTGTRGLQPSLSINTRSSRRFLQGLGVSGQRAVFSLASVLKLAPGWILERSQLQAGPQGHVSGAV